MHGRNHFVGQLADGNAALQGSFDDLVINVGDVADIGHAIPAGAQPFLHHIEGNHHARMSDVAQVINRHAANIHAHMVGFQRNKWLHVTRQRVVDAQRHDARDCLRSKNLLHNR